MRKKTILGTILVFMIIASSILAYTIWDAQTSSYETRTITLADDIIIIRQNVVDYTCDTGVYTMNTFILDRIFTHDYFFAASTWHGDDDVKDQYKGMTGTCFIKIKTRTPKTKECFYNDPTCTSLSQNDKNPCANADDPLLCLYFLRDKPKSNEQDTAEQITKQRTDELFLPPPRWQVFNRTQNITNTYNCTTDGKNNINCLHINPFPTYWYLEKDLVPTTSFPKEYILTCNDKKLRVWAGVSQQAEGLSIPYKPSVQCTHCNCTLEEVKE